MSNKRANLEVIAPTVEEAIAKGLEDLGLSEDAVDIEVLDEGNRGLFGIGSRQARIRLSIKPGSQSDTAALKKSPRTSLKEDTPSKVEASARLEEQREEHKPEIEPVEIAERASTSEDEVVLHVARETVEELLEKMKVRAEVSTNFGETDPHRNRRPIFVDIYGNDLSILIGRRAETLNALQYIATLIVSKELGQAVTLVIDVEGYRTRREQQIRKLARRMADQAIKTGRRQVLEPMPANERRFVHLELKDNPKVTTESFGEEPRRKVTITPQ